MASPESAYTDLVFSPKMDSRFRKAQRDRDNNNTLRSRIRYRLVRRNALKENNKSVAAECLHMIGVSFYQKGNYIKAESAYAKAQEEFEELGAQDFVGFVLRDRGMNELKQGHFSVAEERIQESMTALRDRNQGHYGMSMVILGRIRAAAENPNQNLEEAESHIQEGIGILKETPETFFLSTAYFDLAKVLQANARRSEALSAIAKSEETLNSISQTDFQDRREKLVTLQRQLLEG
ncbi:MAG: hypothetical protein AAB553_07720 [Patescibacteria group bacterium]